MPSLVNLIAWGIATLFVLAFLLLAWRDLARLITRPGTLGFGLGRAWAVGRTTFREAWAARAWGAVLVWAIVCGILLLVVRPHDETEVFSLYVPILMRGQEYVMLVMMLVLACFSLPRERERRTIITTGAKPLSRLELFLGKIFGFVSLSVVLLAMMGVLSWGALHIANQKIKSDAARQYAKEVEDYQNSKEGRTPPSEALKRVANDGLLRAANYITAPKNGMQVAGQIDYRTDPPTRFLKGGSSQFMLYRFPTLWGDPRGVRPSFLFRFAAFPATDKPLPPEINLQVTVAPAGASMLSAIQEKTVTMRTPQGQPEGLMIGQWWPDIGAIFSYGNTAGPAVDMKISCNTEGVYLAVISQNKASNSNVLVLDVDPAKYGEPVVAPAYPPHILGFEKRDLQQIAGPDPKDPASEPEVASWRFVDIDPDKIPGVGGDKFELAMYLDIEKQRNNELPTRARIAAYNRFSFAEPYYVEVNVEEKRQTTVLLPRSLLVKGADLVVDVRCITPGHWIGGKYDSLRLEQPPSPFFFNLIKSETVILCELILLVAISVACSIRLGGPVAMLMGAMCYLLGSIFQFVRDTAGSSVNMLFNVWDQQQLQGNWLYEIFNALVAAVIKSVAFLTYLLPDFTRFDPVGFITDSRNIPLLTVGWDLLWVVAYALPFVAIGYLLIRKQELA